MHPSQIIILVTPVFFALIALEYGVGLRRGRNTYRLHDALASISLGMLSQMINVAAKGLLLGLYVEVYEHAATTDLPETSLWAWVVALILYDFCYYWQHRLGHTVALLWAAHGVHHQSEDYNLSTALRQTGSDWLASWLFYLPMALLGFPPLVFVVVGLIDLLYQYWVHTQQIGKLGWFDRWFCSPSNHRVHHAINERYVDRNYGGILVLWDRLFGSFQEELDDEPCVYGTRAPLRSWNPVWANLQIYAALWAKAGTLPGWGDKLRVWLKPPGWLPGNVAKPVFDHLAQQCFDPPMSEARKRLALLAFVLTLGLTGACLWFAHLMNFPEQIGAVAAVALGLSVVAWICTPTGQARSEIEAGSLLR